MSRVVGWRPKLRIQVYPDHQSATRAIFWCLSIQCLKLGPDSSVHFRKRSERPAASAKPWPLSMDPTIWSSAISRENGVGGRCGRAWRPSASARRWACLCGSSRNSARCTKNPASSLIQWPAVDFGAISHLYARSATRIDKIWPAHPSYAPGQPLCTFRPIDEITLTLASRSFAPADR